MADPFSIFLTVALNVATMAMTMMRKIEGPRLKDLSVTVADYGTPVPYFRGERRIECPIFLAEPLREVKSTEKTKGGKYTEYKYYGTFAALVAGNEVASIVHVWHDRRMIYSSQYEYQNDEVSAKFGTNLRFYSGSEDQAQDPRIVAFIEEKEGVGRAPAYRGYSYLMHEEWPLEKYGNRLPQISVQATTTGSGTGATNEVDSVDGFASGTGTFQMARYSPAGTYGVTTTNQSAKYCKSFVNTKDAYDVKLHDLDAATSGGFTPYVTGPWPCAIDDSGNIYFHGRGFSGSPPARTYKLHRDSATASQIGSDNDVTWIHDLVTMARLGGSDYLVYALGQATAPVAIALRPISTPATVNYQDGDVVFGEATRGYGVFTGSNNDVFAYGQTTAQLGAATTDEMILLRVYGGGASADAITLTGFDAIDPGDLWYPSVHRWGDYIHVIWGFENVPDVYIFDTSYNLLQKVDNADSYLSYLNDSGLSALGGFYSSSNENYDPEAGVAFVYDHSDADWRTTRVIAVNPATGTVEYTRDLTQLTVPPEFQSGGVWPNDVIYNNHLNGFVTSGSGAIGGITAQESIQFIYLAPSDLTLGQLLGEIAELAGMSTDDFDFSALDQPITGYSWVQGAAKDIVASLTELHDSDVRPNGFTVEGIKRNQALGGATIDRKWFVREDDGDGESRPLYTLTAASDSDLPRRVFCIYADTEGEQQPNTAVAQRNADAVSTKRELSVDMGSLAIAPSEIQPMVERFLRRQWTANIQIENVLTAREMDLVPGDVRDIALDDGVVVRSKLLRRITRANRTMECVWERDGAVPVGQTNWEDDTGSLIYDLPTSPGAGQLGRPASGVFEPVDSIGWLLDLPLYDDADDTNAPFVYFAAAPVLGDNAPWTGAGFYASDSGDDGTFETTWDAITSGGAATYGAAYNTLGEVDSNVIDNGTELVVDIVNGTLESVAEADLYANDQTNLALVGDEIIQFRDAVLESGGTYTLRGLLRGQHGTESAMSTHVAGERFILLNAAVRQHSMGAGEINDTDYYKVQTFGFDPDSADTQSLTFAANAHRPLSPVHVELELDGSGDWTITWVRRTRIGGALVDGQDVPLGETSEAYKVKVMDGATVVRTIETTSETATYTSAQQTTDFGSPQSSLTVNVLQVAPDLSLEGFATEASA